jgi:hypothetical protein
MNLRHGCDPPHLSSKADASGVWKNLTLATWVWLLSGLMPKAASTTHWPNHAAIKTIDSFCDSSEVQSQANNSPINLTLTSVVSSNNEVVTAEILWTLKCILSHYSYNSCTNINSLFQNSQIAKILFSPQVYLWRK